MQDKYNGDKEFSDATTSASDYNIECEVYDYPHDDVFHVADERMPPVTIYKNNQLGISINVEEHDDNHEPEKKRLLNPLKKLERLASKTLLKTGDDYDNPERISLVTSQPINMNTRETMSTTSSMLKSGQSNKRTKLGIKQLYQGRIYMFLEHPTGWLCFAYHMGV